MSYFRFIKRNLIVAGDSKENCSDLGSNTHLHLKVRIKFSDHYKFCRRFTFVIYIFILSNKLEFEENTFENRYYLRQWSKLIKWWVFIIRLTAELNWWIESCTNVIKANNKESKPNPKCYTYCIFMRSWYYWPASKLWFWFRSLYSTRMLKWFKKHYDSWATHNQKRRVTK